MKKKVLGNFMFLVLFIVLSLFTTQLLNAAQSFVDCHGQLKVKGNRIVDAYDQPITLRTMSMYPWAEQGRQFWNATAISRLVNEWKVPAIRATILHNRISYDESRLRTVIEACIANGVYVIINWHCIGTTDVNACADFMKRMATDYGHYPNVMYEPWNEPTNQDWATVVKPFHEKVIRAIRSVDPDNIIICGTPQWCQRIQDPAN